MKKGLYVRDISPKQSVDGVFLVKEKKLLRGQTGKPYLLLLLTDHTGELEARIWDRVASFGARFRTGDLIWISGIAVSHQGKLQVKIQDLRRTSSLETKDLVEFVPGYLEALREAEKMHSELLALVGKMEKEELRQLVEGFLTDPLLREGWLTAPAAKTLHHARMGGLLAHTLSVCRLVEAVCQHYPQLRRDLLLAGAVLHDVGKIRELHSAWRPDYTTEGRLLGHLTLGVQMLETKLDAVDAFSQQDAIELQHLILSHHGQLEYGSPRRPKTLEALVLNIIDDLDAKFDAFHKHLLADEGGEKMWTTYHPLFERYLYRGHLAVEAPEDNA